MFLKLVKGTLLAAMVAMVVVGCGNDDKEEEKKPLVVKNRVLESTVAVQWELENWIRARNSSYDPDNNCIQLVNAEVDGVSSRVLEISDKACPATGLSAETDVKVSLQYSEVSGGTAGAATYRLYRRNPSKFYGSFSINSGSTVLTALCDLDLSATQEFASTCKATLGNSRILSIDAI